MKQTGDIQAGNIEIPVVEEGDQPPFFPEGVAAFAIQVVEDFQKPQNEGVEQDIFTSLLAYGHPFALAESDEVVSMFVIAVEHGDLIGADA